MLPEKKYHKLFKILYKTKLRILGVAFKVYTSPEIRLDRNHKLNVYISAAIMPVRLIELNL